MAPSVSTLQNLLLSCEMELDFLDMRINIRKTCCMRVCDRTCANVNIRNGFEILWVDEIRYLEVVILRSTNLRCSLDYVKRSFYRAAVNGIFAKIDRLASEKVILQLITHDKCMQILLYGLDLCALGGLTKTAVA